MKAYGGTATVTVGPALSKSRRKLHVRWASDDEFTGRWVALTAPQMRRLAAMLTRAANKIERGGKNFKAFVAALREKR